MTMVIQNRVIRTGDTMTGDLSLGTNTLTAGVAKLGTTPATAGTVRIPNAAWIASRNAANSADVNMVRVTSGNWLELGVRTFSDNVASGAFGDQTNTLSLRRYSKDPANSVINALGVHLQAAGTIDVSTRSNAIHSTILDNAIVVNKTITGAVSNGGPNLIRITATTHTFTTGDKIAVYGVTGTTEANGAWTITVIDANTFDLQGSTFASAYVSGGTATNRPMMYGVVVNTTLLASRGGLTGTAANADDVAAFVAYNASATPLEATTAFYQGRSSTIFNDITEYEWASGFDATAYNQYWGYGGAGRIGAAGAFFDASRATYDSGAVPIKLPKNIYSLFVDSDGTSNPINFAKYDTTATAITFGAKLQLVDFDLVLGTSTGTKFGTATTQKLAFFNSTPIVQPASTTDLRTALINLGLVATGGASPLNLNGGAFTTTGAASVGTLAATDTITITDAKNIVLGSTTGTQIGTATTQKLGFWGKAPVVQLSAYTPSNVSADRSYNANSTTIDELADVLGTLIADLQLVGLLG